MIDLSDEGWGLVEKYNETFPPEYGLGTIDVRDDLTEKEIISRLTMAISTNTPIKDTDLSIYYDFRSEQERGIRR